MGAAHAKEIKRLAPYAKKQYPDMYHLKESMLITDMRRPDNPIIYANDDFERLTLYPREEIEGKNCRFLQGRHTSEESVDEIREAIKTGMRRDVVLLNYRKDGVPFWNKFTIMPLKADPDDPEKITHFIGVQRDITPIKQAKKEMCAWTPVEVALWAEHLDLWDHALKFIEHGVSGKRLLNMSADSIKFNLDIPENIAEMIFKRVQKHKRGGSSLTFKPKTQVRKVVKAHYKDHRRCFFALDRDTLTTLVARVRTAFPGKFIDDEVEISAVENGEMKLLETDEHVTEILENQKKSATLHLFITRKRAKISDIDLELIAGAEIAICLIDEDNMITFVNHKMCKVTGFARRELINKNWSNLSRTKFAKDDCEERIEKIKTKGKHKLPFITTYKYITNKNIVMFTATCIPNKGKSRSASEWSSEADTLSTSSN